MSQMQPTWDNEQHALVVNVPPLWGCEVCILYTGSIVKRAELINVPADWRIETEINSCQSDPNAAPVAGAYYRFPDNGGVTVQQYAVRPFHNSPVTCLEPHGPAAIPFDVEPIIFGDDDVKEQYESAARICQLSTGDEIQVVVVIKDEGAGGGGGSRGGRTLRDYTDAVVRELLRKHRSSKSVA